MHLRLGGQRYGKRVQAEETKKGRELGGLNAKKGRLGEARDRWRCWVVATWMGSTVKRSKYKNSNIKVKKVLKALLFGGARSFSTLA